MSENKEHWNRAAASAVQAENERVARLPNFDPIASCRKCDSPPIKIEYLFPSPLKFHSSDEFCPTHNGEIRYTCGYCGYAWRTKTADAYRSVKPVYLNQIEAGHILGMIESWVQKSISSNATSELQALHNKIRLATGIGRLLTVSEKEREGEAR